MQQRQTTAFWGVIWFKLKGQGQNEGQRECQSM